MKAAISTPTMSAVAPAELDEMSQIRGPHRRAPQESTPSLEHGDPDALLSRLEDMCAERGLSGLALRLSELTELLAMDLAAFESEFATLPSSQNLAHKSALHLLDHGGKRLRPICVSLAARLGSGFDRRVLDLAVAAELVHSATLLHDDVIDLSDARRGAATARLVYGNAASIFGGDWLLIEALRRVHHAQLPELLAKLLDTIDEMISAEALQLENRGRVDTGRDVYFQVIEGKTAAIFRWAMVAGGRAGGLPPESLDALEKYGLHLGIAFQATDDLLDLTGDTGRTGKELFTDLREGKMTFPLIVALEREPDLRPVIEGILAVPVDVPPPTGSVEKVLEALRRTRAVEECLDLARRHSALAVESLGRLPHGAARRALETVAQAIVDRDL